MRAFFVLGAGRCGTTLLRDALAAHPRVGLTDEARFLDLLHHVHRLAATPDDAEVELELEVPVRTRGVVRRGHTTLAAEVLAAHARAMVLDFYARAFPGRDLAAIGDKMPSPAAALAARATFPDALLVLLARDPRDWLCSVRRYVAKPEIRAHHPHLDVGDGAHLVHWRNVHAGALARRDEGVIHRYEDLVRDPLAVVRDVLGRLDLDLDPACERALAARARFATHGTSASPEASVGRWRRELSEADVALVEETCGEVMEGLGYPRSRAPARRRVAAAPRAAAPADARAATGSEDGAAAETATLDLWRRANGVLAAGTWSVTQGTLRYRGGTFPLLARRGAGCRLVDTTGREYVDWMMAWGPVLLGYRHPAVERAVAAQLAEGPLLSLLHPLEIEVAERVRALVPCADGVAFGKNGSDALAAAVRLARAHTERELVLVCGYHGFHDWYMASVPECAGVPAALRGTVRPFPYGDLDALAALLAAERGRVAAVVMEPAASAEPPPGYLAGVRDLAREHGALLVFDEVVTGFRLARGGAQEAYGVAPDLACLGKGMANGMPLSALVGREAVLRTIPRIGYGLTFRGETLSLAAARATLDVVASEPVCERLAAVGSALRAGFRERCARAGIPADLIGPPARLQLSLGPCGRLTAAGQQALLVQECLRHGVLTNGTFLPSYAHDERAVELTLDALARGLEALARARERDSFQGTLEFPPLSVFFGDESEAEREGAAC